MLTTPTLVESLLVSEGFRALAYDDKQPWLELGPGDEAEVKGKITYGHGLTTREDGSPVQLGDTITDSESRDRVARHIRTEIEPVLENIIHAPLADHQYDALGHAMYQYGGAEMTGWRLIRRINAGEDWEKIVLEWINGTVMFMGEPDFWERRVKEILMFLGMDWRMAPNIPFGTDLLEAIIELGFSGKVPKPGPVHDSDLFEDPELQIPHRGANEVTREKGSDPTPDTPMTLDDAQFLNAEAVGYDGTFDEFMAHRTVVSEKNAIKTPKIDPKLPPKPMEDSKTFSGLSKKESGKESLQMGAVLTGAATTMGTMRELTRDTAATAESASPLIGGFTANHLIIVGLVIGIPLAIIGIIRFVRGHYIAKDGRSEGVQPKV